MRVSVSYNWYGLRRVGGFLVDGLFVATGTGLFGQNFKENPELRLTLALFWMVFYLGLLPNTFGRFFFRLQVVPKGMAVRLVRNLPAICFFFTLYFQNVYQLNERLAGVVQIVSFAFLVVVVFDKSCAAGFYRQTFIDRFVTGSMVLPKEDLLAISRNG